MAARTPSDIPEERVVLVLLDLMKAYPNVPRKACWAVLESLGVPGTMLTVVRALHETTTYEIQSSQGRSKSYVLKRGLREGCPSNCVIFNLYHSWVMGRVEEALRQRFGCDFGLEDQYDRTGAAPIHGVWAERLGYQQRAPEKLDRARLHRVLFADDTTLPAREGTRAVTEEVATETMRKWGEFVHPGKTERLAVDHATNPPAEQDRAHSVRFLGAWLDYNGSTATDTEKRLTSARQIWGRLHAVFRYSSLTPNQKGRIVNASILGSLLYGCQARAYTKGELAKYQSFVDRVIRGICLSKSRTFQDMRGSCDMADLRAEARIELISTTIKQRQLLYLGHIARMPPERWERRMLFGWLLPEAERTGIANQGRPMRTLQYHIAELLDEVAPYDSRPWCIIANEQHGATWEQVVALWRKKPDPGRPRLVVYARLDSESSAPRASACACASARA